MSNAYNFSNDLFKIGNTLSIKSKRREEKMQELVILKNKKSDSAGKQRVTKKTHHKEILTHGK